jgi:hypothetical protein
MGVKRMSGCLGSDKIRLPLAAGSATPLRCIVGQENQAVFQPHVQRELKFYSNNGLLGAKSAVSGWW